MSKLAQTMKHAVAYLQASQSYICKAVISKLFHHDDYDWQCQDRVVWAVK